MNNLFVYETPLAIHVQWEEPPHRFLRGGRWRKDLYYHPDVTIHIAKAATVSRRNHYAIANSIMLALQDAHMPVIALRRLKKTVARRRKKTPTKYKQLSLFPDD